VGEQDEDVRRIFLAGLLALAFAPAAFAAPQASLTIKVEKVSPRGGDIRAALYDQSNYALDSGGTVTDAVVPAHPGETIVTLGPVKPGIYAVKLFQDFNRNGKFDLNWLGYPEEKYGFSNDASPGLTEPSFDDVKFELKPGANTIVVHLQ
jgi:uncharacterized protein (DUF2141 family)